MERTKVFSNMIESIGYENEILEIEYRSGAIYQYSSVPKEIFEGIMSSDSKGKYFHQNIFRKYPEQKTTSSSQDNLFKGMPL
jgi:hypothetical protein